MLTPAHTHVPVRRSESVLFTRVHATDLFAECKIFRLGESVSSQV